MTRAERRKQRYRIKRQRQRYWNAAGAYGGSMVIKTPCPFSAMSLRRYLGVTRQERKAVQVYLEWQD